MCSIFTLIHLRATGNVAAISSVSRPILKAHATGCSEESRPHLSALKWCRTKIPVPAGQATGALGLRSGQRQLAQILAAERQNVERIELNLGILLASMQGEIEGPIDSFTAPAVDDELLLAVLQHCLDDPGGSGSVQLWPFLVKAVTVAALAPPPRRR